MSFGVEESVTNPNAIVGIFWGLARQFYEEKSGICFKTC
jgi:hypothetical protein